MAHSREQLVFRLSASDWYVSLERRVCQTKRYLSNWKSKGLGTSSREFPKRHVAFAPISIPSRFFCAIRAGPFTFSTGLSIFLVSKCVFCLTGIAQPATYGDRFRVRDERSALCLEYLTSILFSTGSVQCPMRLYCCMCHGSLSNLPLIYGHACDVVL